MSMDGDKRSTRIYRKARELALKNKDKATAFPLVIAKKTDGEDVFMEGDKAPKLSDNRKQLDEAKEEETSRNEKEEAVVPNENIHEPAMGKGLAGALKIVKFRVLLKETVEWCGRSTDNKKSKLVGIHENDGNKEINIIRTDECGRVLTQKEAFRQLSHKFHGKKPGKRKQEKRMRQNQEEMKVKQMSNTDTPYQSVEKIREILAQQGTPYLILSGTAASQKKTKYR